MADRQHLTALTLLTQIYIAGQKAWQVHLPKTNLAYSVEL
jgi:hypothetical protein